MDDLNKRLRTLSELLYLQGINNVKDDLDSEPMLVYHIEQIKQAFGDSGYISPSIYQKLIDAIEQFEKDIRTEHNCMTGQEFYDRLLKEMDKNSVPIKSSDWNSDLADWFDKCAKKAAGLE